MRRQRHGKRKKWAALLFLLLAVSAALYALLRLRLIFMEYAINLCEDSAEKTISALMQEKVFNAPEVYENLVTLERDKQNHITALRTNVLAVGRIKAELVSGLFERLEELEHTTVDVPLGSVFAPGFFAGNGPCVKIGMAGLTQVSAEFISAFSAAGINQTRHNILIEIHAGFRILTPVGGEDREIVTRYPVTDTVIVGTVPERYTYIDDTQNSLLGQIRDFE